MIAKPIEPMIIEVAIEYKSLYFCFMKSILFKINIASIITKTNTPRDIIPLEVLKKSKT